MLSDYLVDMLERTFIPSEIYQELKRKYPNLPKRCSNVISKVGAPQWCSKELGHTGSCDYQKEVPSNG